MKTTYTHLLFDLDGTLTDPVEGITRSVQYSLRHFGIDEPDLRKLCPFIGPPLADSFRERYGMSDAEAAEAVAKYREYYAPKGIFENDIYPGIPELLATTAAAGCVNVMATSKPTPFAERIAEHFGFAVKKGNAELLQKLNAALEELKKSGEFAKIEDKWFAK